MLRTLRSRLILSQLLPLMVIVPLMGIALIYGAETQILLPDLLQELDGQARLIVEVAGREPALWTNPQQAQDFVRRISPNVPARLMLLDMQGRLLASSEPADQARLGQKLVHPALDSALAGQGYAAEDYSAQLEGEVADVWVPVAEAHQHLVGVVRLSYRLPAYGRFLQLRYLVLGVLTMGIVLGVAVGSGLALNLERPLRQTAQAIDKMAGGEQLRLLPEDGFQELASLIRAFNMLVDRIRLLEATRQHLLANLVHELGRPLGAMLSATQALQDGAINDPVLRDEFIVGIQDGLLHLRHLLDDLLRLYESALGPLKLNRQTVSVGDWLPSTLVLWRAAALAKPLRWQTAIPAELPRLQLDPDRLAQAIGNLLSNAIKYTPSEGEVVVTAGVAAGAVWIRVTDTGPGIDPETLPHIFEPFYRGPAARRFPQGMGLGLSIAHDIVSAHGGWIEVESPPGQGSEFTLWLPAPGPDGRPTTQPKSTVWAEPTVRARWVPQVKK
jgi:two-component system, OmpR family, sensor histidine kinase BaeS